MRYSLQLVFSVIILCAAVGQASFAQCKQQFYEIPGFQTTSGKTIATLRVGFRTFGKLNAQKSNAILWPTWFTGTSEPICASVAPSTIDTVGRYIIVVDALGNGVSSSPSNTKDFPTVSIRDMVNSQYLLVNNHLGIRHLKAVMGISMGGMQTLEWAVAYPGFADRYISIVGTPKQSAFDIMLWRSEAEPIEKAKAQKSNLEEALRIASNIHTMNLYTPEWWAHAARSNQADSILTAQQKANLAQMKPLDWLCQLYAMMGHDVYQSSKLPAEKLTSIYGPTTLLIVADTDHMVNPETSRQLAMSTGARLLRLTSDCGHMAPACTGSSVRDAVVAFLK